MTRKKAFFAIAAVLLIGGALVLWRITRDEKYDDRVARELPARIEVPSDVTLAIENGGEPLDGRLVWVSIGRESIRVSGRDTIEARAPDAMVFLSALSSPLDFAKKSALEKDASTHAVNVLADKDAPRELVMSMVYTLGQLEFDDVRFVTVRADGTLATRQRSAPSSVRFVE